MTDCQDSNCVCLLQPDAQQIMRIPPDRWLYLRNLSSTAVTTRVNLDGAVTATSGAPAKLEYCLTGETDGAAIHHRVVDSVPQVQADGLGGAQPGKQAGAQAACKHFWLGYPLAQATQYYRCLYCGVEETKEQHLIGLGGAQPVANEPPTPCNHLWQRQYAPTGRPEDRYGCLRCGQVLTGEAARRHRLDEERRRDIEETCRRASASTPTPAHLSRPAHPVRPRALPDPRYVAATVLLGVWAYWRGVPLGIIAGALLCWHVGIATAPLWRAGGRRLADWLVGWRKARKLARLAATRERAEHDWARLYDNRLDKEDGL